MKWFAHIETGPALDPAPAKDEHDYVSRFTKDVTAKWKVSEVPDGTEHGAAPGDVPGTWVNPPPPPEPAQAAVTDAGLTKEDIEILAAAIPVLKKLVG